MIAIVPIRSGSKGIPDKNIKALNGYPLVWWVLDALQKSQVDTVYVSTDSEKYASIVNSFGFDKVEIFYRGDESATDFSSTELVMLELINELKIVDDVMLVQATSPLIKESDINNAIKLYSDFDSILSVVRQKRFIWNEDGSPENYNYKNRPRRQDYDGYLVENGAVYINSSGNILRDRNRLSGKIGLLEMDERTYFEIDDISDWKIISELIKEN